MVRKGRWLTLCPPQAVAVPGFLPVSSRLVPEFSQRPRGCGGEEKAAEKGARGEQRGSSAFLLRGLSFFSFLFFWRAV